MGIFTTTLNQMITLLSLLLIGFLLVKCRVLRPEDAGILSKLENTLFTPALIMGAFIKNFTLDTLKECWKLLLFSLVIELILIPIALLIGKSFRKRERYEQGILAYGLALSNFGFVGNAVMLAVFPEYFMEYVIFTLVLQTVVYVWAVPTLLIPVAQGGGLRARLKSFVNPMFIGLAVGIVLSLLPVELPTSLMSAIDMAGSCMAPIAMLLTGITVASTKLVKALRAPELWMCGALRLVVIPLLALFVFRYLPLPHSYLVCAFCTLAMPVGLNPIVIPTAYGKDTTLAAALALVSHVLAVLSLPLMFLLMTRILL